MKKRSLTLHTPLRTLAFDADDTLWHNETFFQITQERFGALLAPHAPKADLDTILLETERRNIGRYGYGVKGFTLSMIEVAIEVTEGAVPAPVIGEILEAGREMLEHPIELLPGVDKALRDVARNFDVVLITKGDLLHQEEKLAASGLGDLFAAVHVVSEKNAATYLRCLKEPATSMMIGNSMRSDILPALQAGARACHIPFEIEWALEEAQDPIDPQNFFRLANMANLPRFLTQFR